MIDWHIKAREMREAGAKYKDIAAALGKNESTVANVAGKVKCPINHHCLPVRKTPQWHIKAREMRAAGAKLKDIAAALNKKLPAVVWAVRAVKVPIDRQRKPAWPEERKREFKAMWLDGAPTKEIGRRFNLVNPRNYARELRLPRRRETWISWTSKLDNELRRLWRKLRYRRGTNKSFLIRDIAKHFGTTKSAVGMRAMSLGLRQKWGRKEWTDEDDRSFGSSGRTTTSACSKSQSASGTAEAPSQIVAASSDCRRASNPSTASPCTHGKA